MYIICILNNYKKLDVYQFSVRKWMFITFSSEKKRKILTYREYIEELIFNTMCIIYVRRN